MIQFRRSENVLTERFIRLFNAHDIQSNQIPRLITQIKYGDLNNPQTLLTALSPAVIDATAQLFGILPEWLEGLDDKLYQVAWARSTPKAVHNRLTRVIAAKAKDDNPVCLEQFMDGQRANSARGAGMSAPALRASAPNRPEKATNQRQNNQWFCKNAHWVSWRVLLISDPRFGGGCVDLP